MAALLGARLQPGADTVLDAVGFDDILRGASLALTGEGRLDVQTLAGKTPLAVMRRAAAQGIPTVALAGQVADAPALLRAGFRAVMPIAADDDDLECRMRPDVAAQNVRRTAAEAVRRFFDCPGG